MSTIAVVGGVYHETCTRPEWNHIYGSAGRAAAALGGHVDSVSLGCYARTDVARAFEVYAKTYGFSFRPVSGQQSISFEYVHSLSVPIIHPHPAFITKLDPIRVSCDVVLRFGMMESSAIVSAERCVYDPQSAFVPESFSANGSRAEHLAIVGNRGEIVRLGGSDDPIIAARSLLSQDNTEVVVVKCGIWGAQVVERNQVIHVPAYRTDRIWTVGSGDVFAGAFAFAWGVKSLPAAEAARLASRAVAAYVSTMSLPIPNLVELEKSSLPEVMQQNRKVYLAGPFFTMGQRWVIDESKRCLAELGVEVFSPVHDVGPGPARVVAPIDMKALEDCDAVFALLDGTDSGTLFEVGYARALKKRVYALAEAVSEEDLKIVEGTDCLIFDDFVTAIHHVAWAA